MYFYFLQFLQHYQQIEFSIAIFTYISVSSLLQYYNITTLQNTHFAMIAHMFSSLSLQYYNITNLGKPSIKKTGETWEKFQTHTVSEARINHENCNTVADGGGTSLNNPSLGCKRCDVPWS